MDTSHLLPAAIAILSIAGPGIGIGLIGNGALNAMGRNPEISPLLQQNMIVCIVFTEALGIIGAIVSLFILLRIGL